MVEALTENDRAILSRLGASWREVFHVTTVPQAADALGVLLDAARRRRIGDHLRSHPELSPILRRWGALTLTLTEEEKLLGRALALADGALMVPELADRAGLDDAAIRDGLETLAHFGLVTPLDGGYRLAPGWQERLGPLGWNFHRVSVEGEAPFNVPCAVDFLLLANSEYPDRRVVIDDSCAHCTERIRVVLTGKSVAAAEPPEALVFRGGG